MTTDERIAEIAERLQPYTRYWDSPDGREEYSAQVLPEPNWHDAMWLLAEVQRLRAIEGAAKALPEPVYQHQAGAILCTMCRGNGWWVDPQSPVQHTPDCPYLILQRALGAEGA